jgi:hypothetical protein
MNGSATSKEFVPEIQADFRDNNTKRSLP